MISAESLPHTFLPLDSAEARLEAVGGKALNLARLALAGFPIPAGFFIPTAVYREFVAHNDLARQIEAALLAIDLASLDDLSAASEKIRSQFMRGAAPPGLAAALESAWRWLGSGPVAVRSSATAEDLPGMSFAGQQDTFLNVLGNEALLQAVVACWASLWTARAIGYRQRNGIAHHEVSLAVVVQEMVQSEASGVLFTANPLTGLRGETVIDATLGLGEALVGGQVEPDHYVVDSHQTTISQKFLGSKALVISGRSEGGLSSQEGDASQQQAIPDAVILQLAHLGGDIETIFDFPQDIEWAWANGELSILQSRPVTSLFPLPSGMPAEPLKVFFSFAAVQGILDPLTPLGRDALREIFAAGARMFGIKVTRETQSVLHEAGERLWVNFTPLLSNAIGRRIEPVLFGMIEPAARQAIEAIWDDPRLQPGRTTISFRAVRRIARFALPLLAKVLLNLAAPQKRRQYVIENGERVLGLIESRSEAFEGDRWQKAAQRAELLPVFAAEHFGDAFLLFLSAVVAGMASWNLLNKLALGAEDPQGKASTQLVHDLVLQVTRGMPYNPTTEMDLALWQMAKSIRSDPASWQALQAGTAADLSARFLAAELPEVAMQVVGNFLKRYGGRGLGEIDLGRRRWASDPTYIFQMLVNFLAIEDESQAPDVVFARGAESAQLAISQLGLTVRRTPHGRFKARLVPFFAGRTRQLMGARESPKFFAVRLFWVIQRELLKSGLEFTQAGELDSPDDLFYLSLTELKSFADREEEDWRALIAGRRQAYQREMLRKQLPRVLLSDGRAFYEGVSAAGSSGEGLAGSPVSPGSVEGRVRVVIDPTQAGLKPGEILVCPGTDPSWTPLFLSAAGLVMEVGGMMTHGAVVAREYGIPAIVGVGQVTSRLRTGQHIRIDGSTGQIVVLEESPLADPWTG